MVKKHRMEGTTGSASHFDHLFKLLIIGDSSVGKSSILLRFTEDEFDDEHPVTIGARPFQNHPIGLFY